MLPSPIKFSNNLFFDHIRKTVLSYEMLEPKDSVLISLSGGPDSVCLFYTLLSLNFEFDLNIGIFHLNHSLRGDESDEDAEFVKRLASKEGVPFHTEKKDVLAYKKRHKISLEEAARLVRYEAMVQAAKLNGYSKIALGHNADDNAELILMFLLRGSGMKGVGGMEPVRENLFIRPLIHTPKKEILTFLEKNHIPYREDTSNHNIDFTRNKIRHDLIPKLISDYNPNLIQTLNRFIEIVQTEERWIDEIVRETFEKTLMDQKRGEESIDLCLTSLKGLGKALLRRIIRHALLKVKGDLRKISFQHIEAVFELIYHGNEGKGIHLPDGIRIDRLKHSLRMQKADLKNNGKGTDPTCPSYTYDIELPTTGKTICRIKEIDAEVHFTAVILNQQSNWRSAGHCIDFFDMDKIIFPITLRNFRPGDRFTPMGVSGTQKIKKYFIDHKIDSSSRRKIPLLVSKDKVMAILGHRMDEGFKITDTSKTALKVELLLHIRP